jgi:CHAT domain-containing protein/tetratricopeptide (TPR) repeat protein
MKKLLFVLYLFTGGICAAQTNSDLYLQFTQLYKEDKSRQAIPLGESLLPKANAAGDTAIGINTAYLLSDLYLQEGSFFKAKQCIEPAYQMAGIYYKQEGANYGLFALQLGFAFCKMGDAENSSFYLQKGHDIVAKATNEEGPTYIVAVQKMADCMLWFSQAETHDFIETVLVLTIDSYGENSAMYLSKLKWARDGYEKLGDELNKYYTDKDMVRCYEALKETNTEDYRYKLWDWFNNEVNFENHIAAEIALQKIDSLDRLWGKNQYLLETINNKLNYYTKQHRLDKAFALLGQYLQLADGMDKSDTTVYVRELSNIGNLYINLGDYAQAIHHLQKAQTVAKAGRLDAITLFDKTYQYTLQNLALSYTQSGQYQKANDVFAEALQLGNSAFGGKTNLFYYEACIGLGLNYKKIGSYDSAEIYINEGLQVLPYISGITQPQYDISYAALKGALALAKGNYAAAADIYESIYPQIKQHPQLFRFNVLADVYLDYAKALYFAGRYNKIEGLLQQEYLYYQQFIVQNFTTLTQAEKSSFITQYEKNFNAQQAILLRLASQNSAITSLWYNKLLLLKGITLCANYTDDDAAADSFYAENYQQYKNIRQAITQQILQNNDDTLAIKQLQTQANELERKLFKNKPDAGITWNKIQARLAKSDAAIEFLRIDSFDNRPAVYAALVLTTESKYPQLVGLCNAAVLENVTVNNTGASKSNFISSLYAPTRSNELLNDEAAQLLNAGDSLYEWIWKPLATHLKNITNIHYAPAGVMHRIAFAALPYDKGKLLVQKHGLNLVSSTRNINTQKIKNGNGTAVFVGGINYSLSNMPTAQVDGGFERSVENYLGLKSRFVWKPLAGTYQETDMLHNLYTANNKRQVWVTGDSATESFFKALDSTKAEVVHVATHGYFLADNTDKQTDPLFRSGLAFSGVNNIQNNTANDGLLTAFEASNINLAHTQLLVLSACETGLGDIQGNQGVYGLQRAFKMAGAKNIIMSLWQVPDKETAEFMQEFYKRWLAGAHLQKAFTDTQLFMQQKYQPFYWAAFVLLQ